MNPLHWKREHQIALFGAAIVGAFLRELANLNRPQRLWGVAGTVTGAAGGFIRQLYRNEPKI